MHVPDAVAFQLYCRLMDDPAQGGAGLRAMYAPGLEPLKRTLAAFEFLLGARLPALAAHLRAAGLAPVLYASSWFMTAYVAPFPLHFGARILDALLQGGECAVLLRVALALMEALEPDLLGVQDFEALISAIKVRSKCCWMAL
jgi:hypothetical protein